jgi:hypothetical protein
MEKCLHSSSEAKTFLVLNLFDEFIIHMQRAGDFNNPTMRIVQQTSAPSSFSSKVRKETHTFE